jgi:hypothetical protein
LEFNSGIDCANFEQISDNCYGGQNGNTLAEGESGTLGMTDLVIGQYYWIIFDTAPTSNSNCWFTLEVTNGSTGSSPIADVPIIDGPAFLCDSETGDYSITNDVNGASEYEWFIDGGLEDTSVDFEFVPQGPGTYEICATGVSFCETGPGSSPCFEVVVAESTTAEIDLVACLPNCVDYLGNVYWRVHNRPNNYSQCCRLR